MRLNQIAAPNGSRPSSRPATPGAYVTSSLNPARNLPVTSNNIRSKLTTPEELVQFESVPVVENLRKFEASFNELSQSITSFKEEGMVSEVNRLIEIDHEITNGLKLLESHHSLGTEIKSLKKANQDLDLRSKNILKELISCRAKLRNLPKLPASQGNSQNLNNVDVQTVLDYAMKLAKFSKTSATVSSQFIHPNNYIWPAEDALRRGMLATASIKPDELIKAELGQTDSGKEAAPSPVSSDSDVEMEDVDAPVPTETPTNNSALPAANGSANIQKEPAGKPAPASLDLDLFDPEDDDDDSD
ncbi:hypothetical protein JCM33374_g5674 [Metschnikowia sp. JCM 33374]|nr:hypothetical protein JCM33374_g5674 [Metschnikowia sp. JCM 33374]